jgi:hypothetical protein
MQEVSQEPEPGLTNMHEVGGGAEGLTVLQGSVAVKLKVVSMLRGKSSSRGSLDKDGLVTW